MWTGGKIDGFDFVVKRFDEGSEFGINGGRISKLWIGKDGKEYANYDRGWDRRPKGPEEKKVYNEIIRRYN